MSVTGTTCFWNVDGGEMNQNRSWPLWAATSAAARAGVAGTFTGWQPSLTLEETEPGIWWRFRDSNPGPADYDSVALTD